MHSCRSIDVLTLALVLTPCSLACGGAPSAPDAGFVADAPQFVDAGAPDAIALDAPLRDGVSVLAGPDDDFELGDLEPLAAIVGDAELVGIGESVHTTGGQIRMRARMIRWLVTHAGVREIVIESPRTAIETRTEPYVQSCEGDPEEAATGLHSIWWDRSTPALLGWLCTWNAEHPAERVHVRGVDIRQPWDDAPALRDFYASHAPARAPLAEAMSRCLGAGYASELAFFSDPTVLRYYGEGGALATPEADHLACLEAADAVIADLAAHRSELVLASSEREVELARLAAVSMRAFDETIFHLSRGELVNGPRDAAMADVLLTLRRLDPPSGRGVLFAHDGHVMRDSSAVRTAQWRDVENLATLVDRELDYVAIGQISRLAQTDWLGGPQTVRFETSDALEVALDAIGPSLLLDLHAPATPVTDELQHVGFDTMRPAQHYDALVYLRESPANEYFRDPRPGS